MEKNTGNKMKEFWKVEEEWRDIDGYEGSYQVSNFGNVKNLNFRRSGKEQIIKQAVCSGGYLQVDLYKEGKGKIHLVHRLVANAFLPKVENKDEINHTDTDRKNNCVLNLHWVSRDENMFHSRKPIKAIHLETGKEYIFMGQEQAGKELGMNHSSVSKVIRGVKDSVKGYTFKNMVGYVNEDSQG